MKSDRLFDFMGEHPVLTVILVIVILGGISDIIKAFH